MLPFTYGPGGPYMPGAPQGWAYNAYFYDDPAHAHAVTGLSDGDSFQYDANGNMTLRVENGITYQQNFDIENRLSLVVVGPSSVEFIYDGDGNLIKKIADDGTTTTSTVYVGGIYEVTTSASETKETSFYPAGGAMRVAVSGQPSVVYFLLKDHLGSASVTLDEAGELLPDGEQRYAKRPVALSRAAASGRSGLSLRREPDGHGGPAHRPPAPLPSQPSPIPSLAFFQPFRLH